MSNFVKAGQKMSAAWANDVVSDIRSNKRRFKKIVNIIGGGGTVCTAFSKMYSEDGNRFITGGLVFAGDQNFTVAPYQIPETAGTKNLYLAVSVEVNQDDDSEILLPNVKTSTWTPAWSNTSGTYPSNTNPTVGDGDGTCIVPIGSITVTLVEGSSPARYTYEWSPTGCGNVTIKHCVGTLSYVRS